MQAMYEDGYVTVRFPLDVTTGKPSSTGKSVKVGRSNGKVAVDGHQVTVSIDCYIPIAKAAEKPKKDAVSLADAFKMAAAVANKATGPKLVKANGSGK